MLLNVPEIKKKKKNAENTATWKFYSKLREGSKILLQYVFDEGLYMVNILYN